MPQIYGKLSDDPIHREWCDKCNRVGELENRLESANLSEKEKKELRREKRRVESRANDLREELNKSL